ncbi:formate dehydrogenase H [Candidatus Sulfotelmatobacter kueseliae]|uniref:Formate dehydrogenase H n=1 Tax=Candidatus Sulfotelmatobacter kueseliae TaxID=2042962 RepID=A0A2U3L7H5_9BACT|nr:formate dehydrogenase H [Candidatus Sulfotelmatobacter kueseliae]
MLAVPTACPFCSCGCGFHLLAREGQLSGVAPSQTHPVSGGQLCARGWSAHEAALWGDRLRQPLLQRNGKQEPVSWDEALDCVAVRLKQLLAAGKPVGVLGSARATNEENYLAGKFARVGLGTNNLGFSYYSICAPLLAGVEEVCGTPAATLRLNDIASSQVILLIEGDLAETHPRAAGSVLQAVENGAHLITIGCRETQMARVASLHLQTAPGDEYEVIHELSAAVADLGQGRPSVSIRNDAGQQDLEQHFGSLACLQAAEWITRAERAAFLIPPTCGEENRQWKTAAAFTALAAITGHLNRPGSGVLPLLARSNARGACETAVVHNRLPGFERLDDSRSRQRLEDLWGKKLPSAPGWDAEMLLQSVSGLVVVADDPPSVMPIGQKAMTALGRLEFMVVLDAFATPTARIAHALLPISSFAETEGTFTNMEGRVQKLRPATNAPGEARPGWQVLAELCARFDAAASYDSAADVLREIGQAAPQYVGIEQRLAKAGWSGALLEDSAKQKLRIPPAETIAFASLRSAERPHLLALDPAFDWGSDPLVFFSPTLSRDFRSQRKAFPNGFVEIAQEDADELQVRSGRRVRLTSVQGAATVPALVRDDLNHGQLIVPFVFRDHVSNVLGSDSVTAVRIERA